MRSSISGDGRPWSRGAVGPRPLLATVALAVALAARNAAACAAGVCVPTGEGTGLHAGFYLSAALLTGLPFVLLAALGVWLRGSAGRLTRPPTEEPPAPPDQTSPLRIA